MSVIDSKIEKYFTPFLQRDILCTLNKKNIKSGKLILFKHSDFTIELMFSDQKTGKTKKIEIPYPFNVEYWSKENILYLDYRLSKVIDNGELREKYNIFLTKTGKINRFLGNILEISCI